MRDIETSNILDNSVLGDVAFRRKFEPDWKEYSWAMMRAMIKDAIPDKLVEAWAGMAEDWRATSGIVWDKKEKYNYRLDDARHDRRREIMGIRGSPWATPMLQLIFTDGRVQNIPCWWKPVLQSDIAQKGGGIN